METNYDGGLAIAVLPLSSLPLISGFLMVRVNKFRVFLKFSPPSYVYKNWDK